MKRSITAAIFALLALIALSSPAIAQVKRVEMQIDGYLCGN